MTGNTITFQEREKATITQILFTNSVYIKEQPFPCGNLHCLHYAEGIHLLGPQKFETTDRRIIAGTLDSWLSNTISCSKYGQLIYERKMPLVRRQPLLCFFHDSNYLVANTLMQVDILLPTVQQTFAQWLPAKASSRFWETPCRKHMGTMGSARSLLLYGTTPPAHVSSDPSSSPQLPASAYSLAAHSPVSHLITINS